MEWPNYLYMLFGSVYNFPILNAINNVIHTCAACINNSCNTSGQTRLVHINSQRSSMLINMHVTVNQTRCNNTTRCIKLFKYFSFKMRSNRGNPYG